jgi:hypothetical protein
VKKHRCKVCHKADAQKPMCFRGTRWCCDLHRKVVQGELTVEQADEAMRGKTIRESDVMG